MEMHGSCTETFTGAFQELYPRARRLAQRILGNRTAAEDVAAEAMTRAFAHWSEIGGSVSHRTGWVLRVTTNLAIDGVRGKERPAELSDLASKHFPPVADVQDGLTLRLTLTQALRELPQRQREAVVLHYLAGLTQAEVARALAIGPGSVARHVHRGLAALRAQLLDEVIRGGGTLRVKTVQEALRLVGGDQIVLAKVTGRLGGSPLYTVDIGIPAVLKLPGQPGRKPAREDLIGQNVECVVVDVDQERDRVLVATVPAGSEKELYEKRVDVLTALSPGDVRDGTVVSTVTFGAFVDIGDDVYGLLHISELGDVEHPQQALEVGQQVRVEVIQTSPALERVSLRLAGAERGVDE
jgi:RNA polymerase sigma factor (sigma-70 family)